MKKIINNLAYNTETAQKVGCWDNGLMYNDFGFVQEVLHRKKTGEYFLHGEGGGNSKYGVWHGNSGGPGEAIRPYTPDEAREWAEVHLTADEYAAEFGEPDESATGKVQVCLTLLPATRAKLERLRAERKQSISQIIDDLVERYEQHP